MKRLLIFCILTLSATGDQERSPPSAKGDSLNKLFSDPSLSDLLNDPDLWLILKKRLGAPMECSADSRRNNSIIKTKDSVDAGATFISAPLVQSEKECEMECCKEKSCNAAILKIKDAHRKELACYLFDCKTPSVCVFTSHPGFSVLHFSYARDSDQHADELDQLALTSLSTLSSTTSTTTTTTTSMPKVMRPKDNGGSKPADLFSECHQTSDCRDQNTDCLAGYCVCQQGYHVVEMQCRRDCNQELEFECSNKGNALFAECIAVYDYCDGIAQCSDESDESSCLENSKHKGVDLPITEPEMSQGKLQSELTELSNPQGRGRMAYPDQSAALASNVRHDVQDVGPAAQEDSTEARRQPADAGTNHGLVYEESLKDNYKGNRAQAAAAAAALDGINEQNYRQPIAVNSGQMDRTPPKPKSNQGTLDQNPDFKEKTEQDGNGMQNGVGHRPSETGSSYTDQLLAYGTMSSSGKKFRSDLDRGKYRMKAVEKEDSVDKDVSASGYDGHSDTRSMLPASNDDHLSGANRVIAGGSETKDQPPVSNGLESMQFPVGQGRMDVDNTWSEDRMPADKDATVKSLPHSPAFDSRHQNHLKVNEDGGQPGDRRISQGDRLMKQNEDSGLPMQGHYGLSYMSEERPSVNAGETRQGSDGYRQTSDRSKIAYSDIDNEKTKDGGSRPAVIMDEQAARRYRPLDADSGSRHQLNGMNGDPRNHKPLIGLTSKDSSSDVVRDEHRGYYNTGGHMLPERNEFDKTRSRLAEHDGYERQGPKSVDVLPEHIVYDRQGAKSMNASHDQSGYDRPGSKSVDVLPEENNFDRQGLKPVDVMPDRSRYERPGSKAVDAVPERSDYERHGSKSMDGIPEQVGYKQPGLKSSDVLPERVLYERPESKLVNVAPEHGRFDRPGSKLLHPGGKDGMFHGKDHYGGRGGGAVYGTYDNGNYEDEVGNPNYGMWLKAEDQANEQGYIDPRQAIGDSADGYDRDGYLTGRLQPEGAADVYGPDYAQYYYNNNNPGYVKTGRNYLRNGDYDDATDSEVHRNRDHQIVQNNDPPTTASPVPEIQHPVQNSQTKPLNPGTTTTAAATPPGMQLTWQTAVYRTLFNVGENGVMQLPYKTIHINVLYSYGIIIITASPVPEIQHPVQNSQTKPLNPGTTTTAAATPPVKKDVDSDAAKSSLADLSSTQHDPLSVQVKQASQVPDTNAEVKEEKVERFFLRMETNKGAVVALILGIILTTTLLILAGCRLRHFRKRYRKGRHLNSNEADYLINGMYL